MTRGGIPERESLRVEFKSDRARLLSDEDLALAAVCLANAEGGTLFLGVENDGTVTGLNAARRELAGLPAAITGRTSPPLSVRASIVDVGGVRVAQIEVPRSTRLVATTKGLLQRRRLKPDGTPECGPFLPYEFATRESDVGLLDYSALPVRDATIGDLDPVERARLRRAVEAYNGDRALLGLADEELDGALRLVRREGDGRVPTVAGLLLIGREAALRDLLPTHEVAFQVLEGTDVRANEFYRWPLVRLFEQLESQVSARVVEHEVQAGLFRVPIPNVDRRALREAIVNALTHRDYARLGAVQVRWTTDAVSVSSPGGFVDGVRPSNLLTVEPRPRNPTLADAFKRIGLAERTGRGVDLIYEGLLRSGRPAPSYGRSDEHAVVVELPRSDPDLAFVRLVLEQESRLGAPLAITQLIVLDLLRRRRRIDVAEAAEAIQRDTGAARAVLEQLVEVGLVHAHGVKKGRTYTLAAAVYRTLGQQAAWVRQAGFDRLQQEQMIRSLVKQEGEIRRRDVVELCKLGPAQASRLLSSMVEKGLLRRIGARKTARYVPGEKL